MWSEFYFDISIEKIIYSSTDIKEYSLLLKEIFFSYVPGILYRSPFRTPRFFITSFGLSPDAKIAASIIEKTASVAALAVWQALAGDWREEEK